MTFKTRGLLIVFEGLDRSGKRYNNILKTSYSNK